MPLQFNSHGVKWETDVEINDTDTIAVHQYCSDKYVYDNLIYTIIHNLVIDNLGWLNIVDEDSTAIDQLIFLMPDDSQVVII